MPLHPQAKAYLEQRAALNPPPLKSLTPEIVRKGMKALFITFAGELMPVARVENRRIPGPGGQLPIRVYTPDGQGPFPVLVYFHGGGWVIGDLDTHDNICRSLAHQAECVVVSVDYRLAPEHRFPAAPLDAYAATEWVAANAGQLNGDPARIAIGGDSAGGNLATVVCQMARQRGGPRLIFQLLIYPGTDMTMSLPSVQENGMGYGLDRPAIEWFLENYLNNEADKLDPRASPLLAADLSGLPPALIITAEYDPIRDEGEEYGRRMQQAGVPVTISRYEGAIHAFCTLLGVMDQGKAALAEAAAALRAAFASNKD